MQLVLLDRKLAVLSHQKKIPSRKKKTKKRLVRYVQRAGLKRSEVQVVHSTVTVVVVRSASIYAISVLINSLHDYLIIDNNFDIWCSLAGATCIYVDLQPVTGPRRS